MPLSFRRTLFLLPPSRQIPALVVIVGVLFAGCSSVKPIETTLEPTWSAETGPLETIHVSPDGERLLVSSGKHALILNGRNGQPLGEMEESLTAGEILRSGTFVEGVQLSSLDAEQYSFAFLEGTDMALVFDYTMTNNSIEAVDLRSGESIWDNNSYTWSLEKYQAAGAKLTSNVASSFGLRAGQATAVLTTDLLRHQYVEDLIVSLPEQDGFLFKTLDGLKFVDAATGNTLWTAPEVVGSGLEIVRSLPDSGDLLVVTNFTGLLEAAAGSMQVLRLDLQTGEVKWTAGYGADRGDRLHDLQRIGNRIVLSFTGGAAEVFDVETGEELFQTRSGEQSTAEKYMGASLIATEATALPALSDEALYAVHTANFKVIGRPDKFVRKFDLQTGREVWTSSPLGGAHDLLDLRYTEGIVIGRASGTPQVAAWNADTGEQVWRQAEIEPVTNLVVRHETLYVAGEETVYAIDPQTGEVLQEASRSAADTGPSRHLTTRGNDLLVLGTEGVASYTQNELVHQYTTSFQGPFAPGEPPQASHEIKRGTLVLPLGIQSRPRGIHAIDLETGTLLGSLGGLNSGDAHSRPAGSLWDGYFIPQEGRSAYAFRGSNTLVKYQIH